MRKIILSAVLAALYLSSIVFTFRLTLHGYDSNPFTDDPPPVLSYPCDKDNPKKFDAKEETRATYQIIESHRDEKGKRCDFTGCGVGVNLTSWGYKKQNYVLTAAHVVAGLDGKPYEDIMIKIKGDWEFVRVIAIDRANDIAVIECEVKVPHILEISTEEPDVGEKVIDIGAPRYSNVHPVLGTLMIKDDIDKRMWVASAPDYYHGCSGGPLIRLKTHKIVAIASEGILKDFNNMYVGVGKFIKLPIIIKFLDRIKK